MKRDRAGAAPANHFVVNAMDLGGEVLVKKLRSAVADDEIAIGSVAGVACPIGGLSAEQKNHETVWNTNNHGGLTRIP